MKKIIILSLLFAFASCEEKQDDKVKQLDKEGSIEIKTSTQHLNSSFDLLTITHTVYVKGQMIRCTSTYDTIPSLGMIKAESDEDDDGNTQSAMVQKDYEFYITVK